MRPLPEHWRRFRCLPFGAWRRVTAIAAVGMLSAPLAAWSAGGSPYLDLSTGFRSGDFGTTVTSDLYDLTPEVGYVAPAYNAAVSVPLLVLHTSGSGASTTDAGIGDVLARAGARLWQARNAKTDLNAGVAVKFATGDETKGLGTGATNYGGFLSLNHDMFGSTVTLMSGYIIVGSPAGVSYDNVVPYGLSVQYRFSRTNVYTSLQGQTSAVPGLQNPLEWTLGFFHILNADYVLHPDGFVGLSDGSPAFGIRTGFVRWF